MLPLFLCEVIMIDFDRFWMKGNSPYEDESAGAEGEVPRGVTAQEILSWEREYGVTLPEPIRTALSRRNGGFVRNAPIAVLPLDQIVPVDDDFWEHTEIEEEEAPDHGLLFAFGYETEGGTFLMNFNARGPGGPPNVYIDHHGESTYLVNETIGGLFDAALRSSDGPSVDWSEAEASPDLIARETIDMSQVYGGKPASKEQILARRGEALILFTRQLSPAGETLTRTTLPLPLDAGWAEVRPRARATFALHLQPTESAGIIRVESETNDKGGWKNSSNQGVPIYVTFDSTDRDRLQSLRTKLFGTEDSDRAQTIQDRQIALQKMLDTLPPQQRTAAILQAVQAHKEETDRQFAAQFGDLGIVPPELSDTAELLRLKLDQMERALQRTAANPLDPEILRRMQGYPREPDTE
jgi:hypothetical protein